MNKKQGKDLIKHGNEDKEYGQCDSEFCKYNNTNKVIDLGYAQEGERDNVCYCGKCGVGGIKFQEELGKLVEMENKNA